MSRLDRLLGSLALEGNIRVLAAQLVVSQVGFGMFMVVWQPYILARGFTVLELGLVQSTINLSTAMGLFTWGYLSDRYGRKPVVVAATACRGLSIVALLLGGSPVFLYVFAFLVGFSALWMQGNPARSALVLESVDSGKRATAYATLMSVSQMINTAMASAGGYMAVTLGYTPIFLVTLAGEAAGVLIMWKGLRETKAPGAQIKRFRVRDLLPEKELGGLYALLAVMGVGYGVGYSVFYGALIDSLGFTPLDLGLMSTVFNLTWALGSIPGGKLAERIGPRSVLIISAAMSVVTAVGFILFRSLPALLAFSVTNALDPCLWLPNWMSFIADKIPAETRSRVLGKLDAYSRVASIPAPAVGSLIYNAYGFAAPLYVHLGCIAVWFTLLLWVMRSRPAPRP